MQQLVGKFCLTVAPLWILNVWTSRFGKDTGYRGGEATNMQEEFAEYGFSEKQMYVVGAAKVGLAASMLASHRFPRLAVPSSLGLAAFMLGAIGMHIKVKDPIKRSLPAITVLSLSTASAILNRKN